MIKKEDLSMKFVKFIICIAVAIAVVGCGTIRKGAKTGGSEGIDTTTVATGEAENGVLLTNPVEQLSGEWTFITIDKKKVGTLSRPFIAFDFQENRFYGNNGCNVINGNFKCEGSTVSFSDIISTRMACDNETPEHTVMKVFNDAVELRIKEENGIQYLHMFDKKGYELAVLKAQNLVFMNGAWTVEEIDGESVTDENVKLVIDLDQLTIHGNSGCNIVNGTVYIDYGKDWGVQFQQLISTMKMCENIQTEKRLLVALELTETCKPINDSQIALYDGKGECVAVLKRLHLEK